MKLHLDAFKVLNYYELAFSKKLEADASSNIADKELIYNITGENNFFQKEIASRLILPVISALVGVSQIFKQITRSISSILTGRIVEGFNDLLSALIQTLALPIIVVGSLFVPNVINKYIIQNGLKYHEDYQEKFSSVLDRVMNVFIAFLIIPSRALDTVSLGFAAVFSPSPKISEEYIQACIKASPEQSSQGIRRSLKYRWVVEVAGMALCLIGAAIVCPIEGVYSSLGGLCKDSALDITSKHFKSYSSSTIKVQAS